jgi:hypothetical protein
MKKNNSILAFIASLTLVAISCGLQLAPEPQPNPAPENPQVEPFPQGQQPGNPQAQEPQPGEPRPEEPQPVGPPLKAPAEAQIVTLTSSRASLNPGECATLEWNVQGGFGVNLNGEQVQQSGQKQVCPPSATIYRLEVDTGKEMLHQEVTISVAGTGQSQGNPQQPTQVPPTSSGPVPGGCPGAPVISSFTANPTSINAGQSVTLSWGNITNGNASALVKSATLNPGFGEVGSGAGSRSVKPNTTTTYTLTGSGCGGTSSKQVTVTVNSSGLLPITPISIAKWDLALVNIYPSPSGRIMVTIKNTGNTAQKDTVKLMCVGDWRACDVCPYASTAKHVPISLSVGATVDVDTDLGRQSSLTHQAVTCTIFTSSSDSDSSNNSMGPMTVK